MSNSPAFPFEKKKLTAHGHTTAHVEAGEGDQTDTAVAARITTAVGA